MTEGPRELRHVGWTGPTGAMVTAHLHYMVALDNRRGRQQKISNGTAEVITWPPADNGFVGVEIELVHGLDIFKDGHKARFLIDDGETVTLYYVATWHPEERNIGLKQLTSSTIWDPESGGPHPLYHLHVFKREGACA